jgi:hypothetical protein
MQPNDQYFATLSGTELADALCARVDRYQKHCIDSGHFALWLRSYEMYYSQGVDGYTSHEIGRKGAQDQYVVLRINHFRNLMTHFLTLATSQRSALEPKALTADYRAEIETAIARGVLDYYMRAHLEQNTADATEYAVVLGAGFLGQRWNPLIGDEVLPDEALDDQIPDEQGQEEDPDAATRPPPQPRAPLLTGNLESFAFTPMDVAVDPLARKARTDWTITRRYINRWDLIAQFTAEEEEPIRRALRGVHRTRREQDLDFEYAHLRSMASESSALSDEIAVYEFWHRKTPAVPRGRHAVFVNAELLLYAEDLPYHDIPVQRIACANVINTPFAFTPAWDLLAPQQALDMLKSIELTIQRAHGVGLVAVPKGSDLTPTEIATGLNMIEYLPSLGEPKVINFTATPGEVISNQSRLAEDMETLSGVNSVVRGNPEASLKSGSALALVQAQAVQFSSFFQANRIKFLEACGDDTVLIFQRFATEKIRMDVTGVDDTMMAEAFSGADISMVRRVVVDVGNPLAKTLAGRVQLAQELVKMQAIQDPEQFLRVIETGRLEPLTEHESRERSNIRAENEMLAKARFLTNELGQVVTRPKVDPTTGQPAVKNTPAGVVPIMEEVLDDSRLPVALITDNPFLHAQQHAVVLASPFARRSRAVVDAVLSHLKSHEDLHAFATMHRPGLLELMGIPPQQAALQRMMAMQQPAQSPAGGPVPARATAGGGGADPGSTLAPPEDRNLPKMPQMPINPANGSRPEAPGPGGAVAA